MSLAKAARSEEHRSAAQHCGSDLPGSHPDLLTLAIMVGKHLVDMRQILANVQAIEGNAAHGSYALYSEVIVKCPCW